MASTSNVVATPYIHGPSYEKPPFFMVPIMLIREKKWRYSWIVNV